MDNETNENKDSATLLLVAGVYVMLIVIFSAIAVIAHVQIGVNG